MAYSGTATPTRVLIDGRWNVLITVTETECGVADETSCSLKDYIKSGWFRVVRMVQIKTAGSAATTLPVFGTATNPTAGTLGYVGTDPGGAAASHDTSNSGQGWVGNGFTFYHRSVPNAGADNSLTTHYYLLEGWQA